MSSEVAAKCGVISRSCKVVANERRTSGEVKVRRYFAGNSWLIRREVATQFFFLHGVLSMGYERHDVHLVGITILSSADLIKNWEMPQLQCFLASYDQWKCSQFHRPLTVLLRSSNSRKMHAIRAAQGAKKRVQWSLLLTWLNFNPSMDK